MCGSQQFEMMKGISESLSGRIGPLTLLGYSMRELYHMNFNIPFLPTQDYFTARRECLADASYEDIWNIIHGGTLYPIEIKKHADPTKHDVEAFACLEKIPGIQRGEGGVICLYDHLVILKDRDRAIPVSYL